MVEKVSGSGYGWTRSGLVQPSFPRGGWCTVCGAGFTSDGAFDKHRHTTADGRVCRTAEEMVTAGLMLHPSNLYGAVPTEASKARLAALRAARKKG